MTKAKEAIASRPTETVAGVALGLAVFGFETQVGIPGVIAGPVALVIAFGPAFVSSVVDAVKG